MKDFFPLSTHQPVALTRFDAIAVMIVVAVLTLIAAPNRSPSSAPQGEQPLNRGPIEDAQWVAPSSIQPGHQAEIRSFAPRSLLGKDALQPPQVLMASTHIAQWSYHTPDLVTGTRVTEDILGL